jgi:UDP-glucose 4-epimerase
MQGSKKRRRGDPRGAPFSVKTYRWSTVVRSSPSIFLSHTSGDRPPAFSLLDECAIYDVDVNGTHSVLDAAGAAGVGQVLVTSSASAYGSGRS